MTILTEQLLLEHGFTKQDYDTFYIEVDTIFDRSYYNGVGNFYIWKGEKAFSTVIGDYRENVEIKIKTLEELKYIYKLINGNELKKIL